MGLADGAAVIPVDDPQPDARPKRGRLADERRVVLEALDGDALAGPAVLGRMRERSGPAARGRESAVDESRLYPTLYSLEAAWRVRATWLPDDRGVWHRVYSRRRLRPIREQGVQQG